MVGVAGVQAFRQNYPLGMYSVNLSLWDTARNFQPTWRASLDLLHPQNSEEETFFPIRFRVSPQEVIALCDHIESENHAFLGEWLQQKFLTCIAQVVEKTPARITPIIFKGGFTLCFSVDGNLLYYLTNQIERAGNLCPNCYVNPIDKAYKGFCSATCKNQYDNQRDPRKHIRENFRRQMRYNEETEGVFSGIFKDSQGKFGRDKPIFNAICKGINSLYDKGWTKQAIEYQADKWLNTAKELTLKKTPVKKITSLIEKMIEEEKANAPKNP